MLLKTCETCFLVGYILSVYLVLFPALRMTTLHRNLLSEVDGWVNELVVESCDVYSSMGTGEDELISFNHRKYLYLQNRLCILRRVKELMVDKSCVHKLGGFVLDSNALRVSFITFVLTKVISLLFGTVIG